MNKLIRLIGAMLLLAIPLQAQNPTQGDPNRLLKLENGKLGIQTNGATAGQVPTYNGSAVVWGAGGGGGSGTFIANTNGIGVGTTLTNSGLLFWNYGSQLWIDQAIRIDANSNVLFGATGLVAIDAWDHKLKDDSEVDAMDFDGRELYDENGVSSIIFSTDRLLADANTQESINWNNHTLYNFAGAVSMRYGSKTLVGVWTNGTEFYGGILRDVAIDGNSSMVVPSVIDTTARQLSDSGSVLSLDWENKQLRGGGQNSIDWNARSLNDTAGADVITWGNGEIEGSSVGINFNTGRLNGNFIMGVGDDITGGELFDVSIGGNSSLTVANVIDTANRSLFSSTSGANPVVNWEALTLGGDATHPIIVDWGNYQTRGSADTKSIDWDDRKLFQSDGTTETADWQTKKLASNWGIPAISNDLRSVGISLDGQGSAISTGVKSDIRIPYNGTLKGWTILADQSGSIVFDVWKDTIANYPPTVADTITAAAKPALSSMAISNNYTLSGWTTSVSTNDTLRFNVDSASTVTRGTLILYIERN